MEGGGDGRSPLGMNLCGSPARTWHESGKVTTLNELQCKLEEVSESLSEWGINCFRHVRKELQSLNKELDRLRSDPLRTMPSHEEIKVVDRIVELNHREEIMWKQRSQIMWLTVGDKNTRFFHLRASQRTRKNHIAKLKKLDGQYTEDDNEIGKLITSFYFWCPL